MLSQITTKMNIRIVETNTGTKLADESLLYFSFSTLPNCKASNSAFSLFTNKNPRISRCAMMTLRLKRRIIFSTRRCILDCKNDLSKVAAIRLRFTRHTNRKMYKLLQCQTKGSLHTFQYSCFAAIWIACNLPRLCNVP